MNQQVTNIDNINLAYFEQNSNSKKTIFFIHGNSQSSKTWCKQFSSEVLNNYRLIAIDLPAHGSSDACKNPTEYYSPIGTASILSKAIRKLSQDSPFVMVGFSYGTNLVAEILLHDIKPSGIVLAGSCVTGQNYELEKIFANKGESIFFKDEVDEDLVRNFFRMHLRSRKEDDIIIAVRDFFTVKQPFRSTLIQSAYDGKLSDEIIVLAKETVPALVVFGEQEDLVHGDYLDDAPFALWRNKIFRIPEAGHFVHIDQADAFNAVIADYCAEMFIAAHS